MKKKILNIFKIMISAAFLLPVFSTGASAHGWGDSDKDRGFGGKVMRKILDDANLSDAQKKEVKELINANRQTMKDQAQQDGAGNCAGDFSDGYGWGDRDKKRDKGDKGHKNVFNEERASAIKELILKNSLTEADLDSSCFVGGRGSKGGLEQTKGIYFGLHKILNAEQRKEVSKNIDDMADDSRWGWSWGKNRFEKMTDELAKSASLSEEQKKQLLALDPKARRESHSEIRKSSMQTLAAEFKKDAMNEVAINEVLTAANQHREASQKNMRAELISFHSSLSADQKTKISDLVEEKMKSRKSRW